MPVVWVREDPKLETRFHRSPNCRQLRKRPRSGEPRPLVAMDLDDVGVRPCRTCYPDAPRIEIRRTYCVICESMYACAHNGGVPIVDRAGRSRWAWPDANLMPLYRRSA